MADTGSLRHPLVVRFLAEFAVIVLGVLTALAADGWVSDRADRSLEREYLERLRDEIVAHLEEVEQTSRLNLWGFAGGERLLAVLSEGSWSERPEQLVPSSSVRARSRNSTPNSGPIRSS